MGAYECLREGDVCAVRLFSGLVVDDEPFETVTHGDGNGLFRSRRGNR